MHKIDVNEKSLPVLLDLFLNKVKLQDGENVLYKAYVYNGIPTFQFIYSQGSGVSISEPYTMCGRFNVKTIWNIFESTLEYLLVDYGIYNSVDQSLRYDLSDVFEEYDDVGAFDG